MRLATWNLWWRFGDWSARGAAIGRVLADLNADIIGLQEVWFTSERNFATSLADELGYQVAFAPSPAPQKWQQRIDDDTVGIGNAVLSRWPITSETMIVLPTGGARDEGRVALHTVVDAPFGTMPFTTTHLNAAWGQSAIRTEQLRATAQLMADEPGQEYPPVLCGDFNAMDDYDEVRSLAGKTSNVMPGEPLLDAWKFVRPDDPGLTWDPRNPYVHATHEPAARIDYLFTGIAKGSGLGRPLDAGLFGTDPVDGVWPSDHFGVWVDVQSQV